MGGSEGRLERRRVAKRAAIRAVAVRLALEHGPDAVTVEMISKAADISPRTFFNYFRAKDDAFSIEPHQWTAEEMLGELKARPEGEAPAESMRVVIKAMAAAADFAHLAEEWELLQRLYARYPELFSRMRFGEVDATIAALSAEIAARRGTDPAQDLYPGMLVGASFAALQAAENQARHGERSLDELIDEAFNLLVQGL
ncbi:TetR family transcriptional regulator [Amycolatopsis sp. NPDC059027]|uniref:TetR family transcriptional regulator n=1 Tax=Amycolatopsis sp. NPDC059027 TaxID=3346709 RepID=UPI00366DAD5F